MTRFVPYLAEEFIERDAAALLLEYAHARGVNIVPPVPVEDIVEKHLKLGMGFDDTHKLFGVPRGSESNADILGAMFFDEARIVIDESLDPEENPAREGRYRFTLAHEGGGHWRLHRDLFAKDPAQVSLFDEPVKPSVICRSSQAKERVEWQADYYASCLLMPRHLVLEVWWRRYGSTAPFIHEIFRSDPRFSRYGSTWIQVGEPLPRILNIDGVDGHLTLFNRIAREFAESFKVSTEAMRIRLEKLELLLRETPRQRIFEGA